MSELDDLMTRVGPWDERAADSLVERAHSLSRSMLVLAEGSSMHALAVACWMMLDAAAKAVPEDGQGIAIANLFAAARQCVDHGVTLAAAMPYVLAGFGEDSEGGNA